ncbi:hypothetical protein, partial [Nitrospina gracilis]
AFLLLKTPGQGPTLIFLLRGPAVPHTGNMTPVPETPDSPFNAFEFLVSFLCGMVAFAVLTLLFIAAVFLYIYLVFDVLPFIGRECKNFSCLP